MSDTNLDKQFDSILRTQESKLERKLRSNFNKMSKDMQRAFLDNGQFGADAVVSKNDEVLAEILLEAYKSGVVAGSGFAFSQVEERDKKKQKELSTETLQLLSTSLALEAIETAQQINRTTKKIYLEISEEVEQEQKSHGEIETKGIRDLFGRAFDKVKEVAKRLKLRNYTRAKSIATTESQNGIQNGIEESAEILNQQALIVLRKTWTSQGDSRVRDSHARVSGQTKDIGEFFLVGRGRGRRPLDKSLPIEEIIGCRCYLRLSKHSILTEV